MANVLYDQNGRELKRYDDYALPHGITFTSMPRGGSFPTWSYLHDRWDESLKNSRKNAEAMWNDAWLQSLVNERIRASTSLKWHLEPDEPRDKTQKWAADLCTRAVKRTPRLRRFVRQLGKASWFGRYANQVEWDWVAINGQHCLIVKKHIPIHGDKLGFTLAHQPYVLVNSGNLDQLGKAEVILTTKGKAVVLKGSWRDKFLLHTSQPDDVDFFNAEQASAIHGVGIRSRIYWNWFLRDEFLSWITDQLERTGLGLVVLLFEAGNDASEAAAKKLAQNYSRRAVITVPVAPGSLSGRSGAASGAPFQVIETPTQGIEILDKLRQRIEDQIERYIVGQSMSGGKDKEDGLGGTGRANFAAETKRDIVMEDSDELAETLTGSVEEPGLVSMIFRHSLPKLWGRFGLRWVFDLEETHPDKKLEAINKVFQMGGDFITDEVRGLTGMAKPQEGDDTLSIEAQQQQQMQAQQQGQMAQQSHEIAQGQQQHQQAMQQGEQKHQQGMAQSQQEHQQKLAHSSAEQQHAQQLAQAKMAHEASMQPPAATNANVGACPLAPPPVQPANGQKPLAWQPASRMQRPARPARAAPGQSPDSNRFLSWLAREAQGNGEGAAQYAFDPDQQRGDDGQWTAGGGGGKIRSAAHAVVTKAKALRKALRPSNILRTVREAAHLARHPVETVKRAKVFAIKRFKKLRDRYGVAGAVAIAGAYAGYYAVAAANPVMFAIPVPLTITIMSSAEAIRFGLRKVAGKRTEEAAVQHARGDEEGGSLLKAALDFIRELAEESGEDVPELDKEILQEVIDHLEQAAGGEEGDALGYAKDAAGHEHKGKGEGGGQFTSTGEGGNGTAATAEKPDFTKAAATRGAMMTAIRDGKGPDAKILLRNNQLAPPHIKPSMVPPDWTDVQVSLDPGAELLVKAIDNKGRPKSVYSDAHDLRTEAVKFARVDEMIRQGPAIDKEIQAARANPKTKEQAECAWLMSAQATRPGSKSDTGAKVKAYGATTLEGRHVIIDAGGTVRLHFIGKEGVLHDHVIHDPKLAAMLKDRKEKAGDTGTLFKTSEGAVNTFIGKLDGGHFSSKDFRTRRANLIAVRAMAKFEGVPKDDKEYKARVKAIAYQVSTVLGNKPAQCLESYINPTIFAIWKGTKS